MPKPTQATPPPGQAPPRRPTYPEAVARYESGLRLMQEHRFGEAIAELQALLTRYPEEKELAERVRVHLTVCDRHQRSAQPNPKSPEERLYAATLALNAGDIAGAIGHLEAVLLDDDQHEGALYMLAVGHAQIDDRSAAVNYLQRAITSNPDNHRIALRDSDLERLLQDESVRADLQATAEAAASARRAARTRSLR